MSPILQILDFVDEIMQGKERAKENLVVLGVYAACFMGAAVLYHSFSDQDFSYILVMSVCLQALAFFMLLHKMKVKKSVAGVSSRSMQMYMLSIMCRLTSTLIKNGYLPVDRTGDWVYQSADIASLCLCFQVLYFIHKKYPATYQKNLDTMPIWKFVPCVFVLAGFIHGELNHSWFFDVMWTAAMDLSTVAMLPQLWMLVAKSGDLEAIAANFVVLMFASSLCSFCFWHKGFPELAPEDGSFNKMGWLIMTNHTLQLLFSADLCFYFFKKQVARYRRDCSGQHYTKSMVRPVGNVM